VEPSAVAARRTRASLALAVAGAIVLMAGVALVLSGEAIKLEHQARPPSLIGPGLVLAFLGLALGASAAVTILLDAPARLPVAHPLAPAAPGDPSAAAAWTEVVPGAVLSPPGRVGPAFTGPATPGPAAPGPGPGAREPVAGEVPGYSDAGWGAGTDSRTWPDPPAEPPQEIHHPVRR
jgi:hypothetical protein